MPATTHPTATDPVAFARLVEPHRSALQAHCYRMLGSLPDAEDAVQDALVLAWRGLGGFEGRSSLRAWLFRIATNVCLKQLERGPRRLHPVDLGPAHTGVELAAPRDDLPWLTPFPVAAHDGYEQRESIELAFIAALQHLPARQRAVLLLRDVLGFRPAEIARMLDTSAAAVSSALQRAHETVAARAPALTQQETLERLGDEQLRAVVERYVAAWERDDVAAIVAMLTEDAAFAMPPRSEWFRGRDAIERFLRAWPMAPPRRRWRMRPVTVNGQAGVATWRMRGDAAEPHGIAALTLTPDGRIAAVTTFFMPDLFPAFGLPMDPAAPPDQ